MCRLSCTTSGIHPNPNPHFCKPVGIRLRRWWFYLGLIPFTFLFAGCTTTEKPESHGNLYQCYFQMILQLHCTWEGNPISHDVLCQPIANRKNFGSIARCIARGLERIPWKTFNGWIGWSLLLCTETMCNAIRTVRLAQYLWLGGRPTLLF